MADMAGNNGVTVNLDATEQTADAGGPTRETLLDGAGVTQDGEQTSGTEQPLEPAQEGAQAPGEYEAFTLPQGMDPEDTEVSVALEEATGVFRELGLNQQQAQRLIDLHMKHYIGALAEDQERFERELNRRVAGWGMEVKGDPEFGGARLNQSLTSVERAIANLGGKPLRHALSEETGLINHPEIFRAFVRMGRYFSEDKLVMGANRKGSDDSPHGMAARVYPNMN